MRTSRIAGAAIAVAATGVLLASGLTTLSASAHEAGDSSTNLSVIVNKPLRQLANRLDLRIGTAVDTTALASDAPYERLVAEQFSSVTAENVMKWQLIEPQRGQFTYEAADRLVAYARDHGQKVRGHTLIWHNQLPTWLTTGTFTDAELRQILRQHIIDEVTHFKGKIWQWDVVNEAFNDDGTLRNTMWLQRLGPGYIADAFRWAHQADPKAQLFYNDYNIEGISPKSDAAYALIKQLLKDRVPIHGIGIQGHFGTQYGFNGDVPENMARFAALGLDVAVTEADVRSVLPMDNPKTQAQAEGYSVLLGACLLTPRCHSYTVWGFSDKYQWVPSVFAGQGSAALYDENFNAKPAYRSLQRDLALANNRR